MVASWQTSNTTSETLRVLEQKLYVRKSIMPVQKVVSMNTMCSDNTSTKVVGTTPDIIKTGPDGIEIDKLKISYVNADGFKVFNEVEYDGEEYYLEEDSTGKSSSFYVNRGDRIDG